MEDMNLTQIAELQKDFSQFETVNPLKKTSDVRVIPQTDNGKCNYKAMSKSFSIEQLTDDFIQKEVDEKFPLCPNDATKEEKKAQNGKRAKYKAALIDHKDTGMKTAIRPLEPIITTEKVCPSISVEQGQTVEELRKRIMELAPNQDPSNVETFDKEKCLVVIAGISQKRLSISDDYLNQYAFYALLGVGKMAEASSSWTYQNFGVSFQGVVANHLENQKQMEEVIGMVMAENPMFREYVTPMTLLMMTVAQSYVKTAAVNMQKNLVGSSPPGN